MNNLDIIYEDEDIILVHKRAGVATQTKRLGQQDMESLLKNYRVKKKEQPYIGVVHRLDQPVEGVMVFAKNQKAAAGLSKQVQQHVIGKYYYALTEKVPAQKKGMLEDYLLTDKKTNVTRVVEEEERKKWFDNEEILSEDVVELAKSYYTAGADELIFLDLSKADDDHEEAIDLLKKITRAVQIPVIAGGNIRRLEDVKKYLYAGAKKAIINMARTSGPTLIEDAAKRFGQEKVAVSLNDFDRLFKQQQLIEKYTSEIVFMHRPDLESVVNLTNLPTVILTDVMEEAEVFRILKCNGIKGVSGRFVSQKGFSLAEFKEKCIGMNISMSTYQCMVDFSEFKLNSDGLLPVIAQDYKSGKVLMLAYMNREAFENTIRTDKMTYYSRSRKQLWVKGETSGHYQYVKSLTIDCDKDTLLAKVEQIGPACHTGNTTCFYQTVVGQEFDSANPLRVFEDVYATILDRKANPKEGSYTNYVFDKGIDKILKKIGEEATELVIAAKNPNPEEIKYELSDFLYHAMVLMVERGVTWEDIVNELANR